MGPRTTLVIGATGILAPAAASLRASGGEVIAVSRGGGGEGVAVAVDAQDTGGLATALAGMHWRDAIVYSRTVTDASLEWVRGVTPGRCVLVRTSAAADPALGALDVPADTLQLGWREGAVTDRWHSRAEVSAAALEVLADGEGRILGVVRPWSDRP